MIRGSFQHHHCDALVTEAGDRVVVRTEGIMVTIAHQGDHLMVITNHPVPGMTKDEASSHYVRQIKLQLPEDAS